MEIKILFRMLLKQWWIVLAAMIITIGGTLIFTQLQTPIYSATITYIVTPSQELLNGSSFVNGLSVLGGQSTITNTYANIATSATIRENAVDNMGITQQQNNSLSVSSRVRSGTNMIEIKVEGPDPKIVRGFANEIGKSTIHYVGTLYEVYDMKILDSASLPTHPVSPNMKLNLALGAFFGLILGSGMALAMGTINLRQPEPVNQFKDIPAEGSLSGKYLP